MFLSSGSGNFLISRMQEMPSNICFRLILYILISLQSVFSIFFCYSLKKIRLFFILSFIFPHSVFFFTKFPLNSIKKAIIL